MRRDLRILEPRPPKRSCVLLNALDTADLRLGLHCAFSAPEEGDQCGETGSGLAAAKGRRVGAAEPGMAISNEGLCFRPGRRPISSHCEIGTVTKR